MKTKIVLWILILGLFTAISNASLNDGLMYCYTMDDADNINGVQTNKVDASYGNGTITSATSGTGYVNQARDYYPENSRMTITDWNPAGGVWSLGLMFNNTNANTQGAFFGREVSASEYFTLRWETDKDLAVYFKTDASNIAHGEVNNIRDNWDTGDYYSMLFQRMRANDCSYTMWNVSINGTEQSVIQLGSNTGSACTLLNGQDHYVGFYHSDPFSFEGNIDSVAIWNRTLSNLEEIEWRSWLSNGTQCNFTPSGAPPPATSHKDYITVSNFTNTSITNSSISMSWDTQGNYSYSEVWYNGLLGYNGSVNETTITGLSNNTEYLFNLTVFWNTTLYNTTQKYMSTNQTIQMDWLGWTYAQVVNFKEEIEMLAIYVLYLGLFGLAYWLLKTGNMFIGIIFLVQSIGLDFWIVQDFYTDYISGNTVTSGWTYGFIGLAGFFILSAFLFKIFMPFYLRKPKTS